MIVKCEWTACKHNSGEGCIGTCQKDGDIELEQMFSSGEALLLCKNFEWRKGE